MKCETTNWPDPLVGELLVVANDLEGIAVQRQDFDELGM